MPASTVYGTFLHPAGAAAEIPPPSSGRGGRTALTRTMSTQGSDSDEEIAETRAVLWEVVHLRQDGLPDTARADANFLAAMVTVLGLVVGGVYGGVAMGGVMGPFVGMVRGGMRWQDLGGMM